MSLPSAGKIIATEKKDSDYKSSDHVKDKAPTPGRAETSSTPRMKTTGQIKKNDPSSESDGGILKSPAQISKKGSMRNRLFSSPLLDENDSDDEEIFNHFEEKYHEEMRREDAMDKKRKAREEKINSGMSVGVDVKEAPGSKSRLNLGKLFDSRADDKPTSPRAKGTNTNLVAKTRSTFHGDEKTSSALSPRSPRGSAPKKPAISFQGDGDEDDASGSSANASGAISSTPSTPSTSMTWKSRTAMRGEGEQSTTVSPRSFPQDAQASTEFIKKITLRLPVLKGEETEASSEEKSVTLSPVSPRGTSSGGSEFMKKLSFRSAQPSDHFSSSSASGSHWGLMATQIDQLFDEPWHFGLDAQGAPDLSKIPEGILMDLSNLCYAIINNENFKKKPDDEKKTYLGKQIGRAFIQLVEQHLRREGAGKILGSAEKMKSYLKSHFGILIGEEKSKRAGFRLSVPKENFNKLGQERAEFHEILMQNLAFRMKLYEVEIVLGEHGPEERKLVRTCLRDSFKSNYQSETVEFSDQENSLVSATFKRDFGKSEYYVENDQGTLEKLDDIEQFISLLGAAKNKELCYKISHHANRNLPICLKNLLYFRKAKDGQIQSVLRLYDGTPLSISDTQKSSYVLKKQSDGGWLLKYKGVVDTRTSAAMGKNTATLFIKEGNDVIRKAVVIDNATAEISYDIWFDANGEATYSGNPKIKARGWNQVTQM